MGSFWGENNVPQYSVRGRDPGLDLDIPCSRHREMLFRERSPTRRIGVQFLINKFGSGRL